jgi:hypothetical protein
LSCPRFAAVTHVTVTALDIGAPVTGGAVDDATERLIVIKDHRSAIHLD